MTSAAADVDSVVPVRRARRRGGGPDAGPALKGVAVAAAALRASSAVLEQRRDCAVAAALAAGATWAQLGEALGVSPQAAHKRFKGLAPAARRAGTAQHEAPVPAPGRAATLRGESVMVRLGRLAELAQRSSDAAVAAPFGLGRTDAKVIRELSRHGTLSGVELRRHCGVDKAGISRAVCLLQRRGLVERVRDPGGGPARYRLTAAGTRHCAEDVMPLVAARHNAALRGLPPDAVNVILDALMGNLEAMLSARDS